MMKFQLSSESASLLGWDQILERLAGNARTPLGQAACLKLMPAVDPERIVTAQARHRQMTWLADQGESPPIETVEEIELDLLRAGKGGTLNPEGILRVSQAMRVSSRVRGFLMRRGDQAGQQDGQQGGSVLVDLARGSHDLADLGRDLEMAFDPDGCLRDSASPELMQLRRRATQLAEGIRTRMERMLRSSGISSALSDPYVTQRGDRYVLPVRSDSRGEIEGIVHDTSQSGATLFIEPSGLIAEGNRLKIAQAAALEEERRILAQYSSEIAQAADPLRDNLRMLAKADLVWASVQLGQRMGGQLVEVAGPGFDLRKARHPLMALGRDPVVANDIHLAQDRKVLVVTGPNAGGKTVVLKTLGLCCLMAQAGLAIPAQEGTRLGLHLSLSAIIGDSQDIDQGWSTFSAHMNSIGQVLQTAGTSSLVLIDELAADTDPRHGAALAAAILESLADSGACALVTTHFEELKQLPYQDQRFANASVGFDLNSMEPTFLLHPDLPGRSLTLDIARRLGLSEKVLARAAARLDGNEVQLESMLESLESERQSIAALRTTLEDLHSRAREEAEEHQRAGERLEARRQELLGQGREQLLAEIASARRQVASIIETLRSGGTKGQDMRRAVDASHDLISLADKLQAGREKQKEQTEPEQRQVGLPPKDLRPGDRVRLPHLDKEGTVDSLDRAGSMVSVQLGAIRTRVALEQVELLSRCPRPAPSPPRKNKKSVLKEARPTEVRSSQNTLDLRGMRVDEALDRVDKFLDDQFGASQSCAFIIHGHGTGALKTAVREYLSSSPYQSHFRAGVQDEGGDGITVVALR